MMSSPRQLSCNATNTTVKSCQCWLIFRQKRKPRLKKNWSLSSTRLSHCMIGNQVRFLMRRSFASFKEFSHKNWCVMGDPSTLSKLQWTLDSLTTALSQICSVKISTKIRTNKVLVIWLERILRSNVKHFSGNSSPKTAFKVTSMAKQGCGIRNLYLVR